MFFFLLFCFRFYSHFDPLSKIRVKTATFFFTCFKNIIHPFCFDDVFSVYFYIFAYITQFRFWEYLRFVFTPFLTQCLLSNSHVYSSLNSVLVGFIFSLGQSKTFSFDIVYICVSFTSNLTFAAYLFCLIFFFILLSWILIHLFMTIVIMD